MNMSRVHIGIVVMAGVVLGSASIYGLTVASAPAAIPQLNQPTVHFTFSVEEPDGQAFDGVLEVTVTQDPVKESILGGPTHAGKRRWADISFLSIGGVVDETVVLPDLDNLGGGLFLEMSPGFPAYTGLVPLAGRISSDADTLRRSGFAFRPNLDSSGQQTVTFADTFRLVSPPSIGSVLINGSVHATASLRALPVVGVPGGRLSDALGSDMVIPTGARTNLYSWSTGQSGFELIAQAGTGATGELGSATMRHASSCTITLNAIGAVQVVAASSFEDVRFACLWPSANYLPLDLSSGLPPSALVFSRATYCKNSGVFSSQGGAFTIQFSRLPVGAYTVEVWLSDDLSTGLVSHLFQNVTVAAGQTKQLSIP